MSKRLDKIQERVDRMYRHEDVSRKVRKAIALIKYKNKWIHLKDCYEELLAYGIAKTERASLKKQLREEISFSGKATTSIVSLIKVNNDELKYAWKIICDKKPVEPQQIISNIPEDLLEEFGTAKRMDII